MSAVVLASGARTTRRHRFVVAPCALAVVVSGAGALGVSAARAGQWAQITCTNPDTGTDAGAAGWTQQITGSPAVSSSAPTTDVGCGINDVLAEDSGPGSIIQCTWTPPQGSTLAGGTIDGSLTAHHRHQKGRRTKGKRTQGTQRPRP